MCEFKFGKTVLVKPCPDLLIDMSVAFKHYLFYNNYKTSYTPYINHARWHRCSRFGGLRVGGNRSTRGNTPVWLGDHMPISHADAGY